MKNLFALMLSLMMALCMTACSSNEAEEAIETEDTNEVVELDTNVYVALGSEELDLDSLVLPLDDYEYVSIEIDEDKSDYDLSTAGEYTLVVVLTHEDGTTTELSLVLVVNEEEVVEEKVAAQLTAKLAAKNNTLDTLANLTDDESTTSTTSSSSSSSSSSWNGGLNTDPTVYGLDPDNVWVQEAMKLLGQSGLCSYIASDLRIAVYGSIHNIPANVGELVGVDWETISENLQVGDSIYYYNMKSGSSTITSHVAIYLGNGLALHGNWTGGVARIASAYQEAEGYALYSTTHTVSSSSCSSCTASSGSSSSSSSEKTEEEKLAVLESVGIDTTGMSKETTCSKEVTDMTTDELDYCVYMGYIG